MMQRLQKRYREQVRSELMKEFGYRNIMETPRLEKIVVNVGVGEALDNAKALDHTVQDIATITGQ
ncbi:MAG: 50S ribosomal protein L5, partial [Anaerolineae bacterium]